MVEPSVGILSGCGVNTQPQLIKLLPEAVPVTNQNLLQGGSCSGQERLDLFEVHAQGPEAPDPLQPSNLGGAVDAVAGLGSSGRRE